MIFPYRKLILGPKKPKFSGKTSEIGQTKEEIGTILNKGQER